MNYEQKRCLFCEKQVQVEVSEESFLFKNCYCAPGSQYEVTKNALDAFNDLNLSVKREYFHIVSGYIREMEDTSHCVSLTMEDVEDIRNSPLIPITLDDKCIKCLSFLYRHSKEPGQPVIMPSFQQSSNITYSPNLQEFVHILELLQQDKLVDRVGFQLKLTPKGWKTAIERLEQHQLKPCFIAITQDSELRESWAAHVFPRLKQMGYLPRFLEKERGTPPLDQAMEQIRESELVIADMSDHPREVYYTAGFARGLNVPVIVTLRQEDYDKMPGDSYVSRPILWDEPENLADLLQHRLLL